MGHMTGCYVRTGRLAVQWLIIEKNVSSVGLQKLSLVQAAQKYRLINTNIPRPECADYPFVSGGGTGGYQGRTNWRLGYRECLL